MQSSETQKFANLDKLSKPDIKDIMHLVYNSLKEKGYSPINQIVGYILSGDPTYITGHNNARNLIAKIDRDELLEEIVRVYISESQK